MTDRTVQIRLIGQFQGYLAQVKAAEVATMRFVGTLEKSAAKRAALNDLGSTAGKFGVAAALGFGLAVKSAASFEQAMSNVRAVLSEKDIGKIGALRDLAIEQGKATKFSAGEAAEGIEQLTKAGVGADAILGGGLKGSLALAAAGNISVADAAGTAAVAMNQFELAGSDVPHIADLLAAASNKAQGEVSDMATALKYVGPVAHSMGVSIEETTGTIAELAQAGIQGDQAGTSLRGMLTALTSPSKIAAKEMQQLGINVYDAQGNFVGFRGVAEQLHGSMKNLTNAERDQAFGRIFGNQQITAARVLYNGGAAAVDNWTRKVNDQNAAVDMAAIKMDNLNGDLEQLRGSLETAFIGAGGGAQGPLREMTQDLTALVNAYIALPAPIKSVGTALLGFGGLLGIGTFAVTRMMTGIASTRANLTELGASAGGLGRKFDGPRLAMMEMGDSFRTTSAESGKLRGTLAATATGFSQFGRGAARGAAGVAALGLQMSGFTERSDTAGDAAKVLTGALAGFALTDGPWGAALGAGAGLLAVFASRSQRAAQAQAMLDSVAKSVTATLDKQGNATKGTATALFGQLQDQHLDQLAQKLGANMGTVAEATTNSADAWADLEQQVGVTRKQLEGKSFFDMTDEEKSALVLFQSIGDLNGALKQSKGDFDRSKSAAKGAADGFGDMAGAVDKNTVSLHKFTDALFRAENAILQQRGDMRSYEAAIDDATASVKENGRTLDRHTPKGRANAEALDRIAAAALSVADEMVDGSKRQTQFLQSARGQLFQTARAMGMSKNAAHAYVNEVLRIPKSAYTKVTVDTGGAIGKIAGVLGLLSQVKDKDVYVRVHTESQTRRSDRATGGLVLGPGTGTSDSIDARLSNGEFVVRASQARKHLDELHRINTPGFARGGEVRSALRGFGVDGDRQTASEVRTELHELLVELRQAFGKDSHIVNATERLGKHMLDVAARQDKWQRSLEKLRTSRADLASSARDSFNHDIFGGGFHQGLIQLRADSNDSKKMRRLLRRAKSLGIHGPALAALAASGDLQFLEELDTKREATQFQHAFAGRLQSQQALGSFAGNAVYGKAIHEQTRHIRAMSRRIEHIEHHIKRGVYEGARDGIRDQNKAAARARR